MQVFRPERSFFRHPLVQQKLSRLELCLMKKKCEGTNSYKTLPSMARSKSLTKTELLNIQVTSR
jgi:hypothetical protein